MKSSKKRVELKLNIVFGVVVLLASSVVAGEKFAPVCVVKSIVGYLYVKPAGTEKFTLAKIGQFLYPKDSLRTYDGCRAELVFSDGTTLWMDENTDLTLKKKESKIKKGIFYNFLRMLFGRIRCAVLKGNEFELDTHSAIVAVKGTDFEVKADKEKTTLIVFEGILEVMNRLGRVLVEESHRCITYWQQAPQQPEKINLGNIEDWRVQLECPRLQMTTETTDVISGTVIEVELFVVNIYEKRMDTLEQEAEVNIKSTSVGALLLSSDMKLWQEEISLKLKKPTKFYVKINETFSGKVALICSSLDFQPAELILKVSLQENKEKSLIIELIDKDNIKRKIILKYSPQ